MILLSAKVSGVRDLIEVYPSWPPAVTTCFTLV